MNKLIPIKEINIAPHRLQAILKLHHIRYWQILRRLDSLGLGMNEPRLCTILCGREKPKKQVEEAFDYIIAELNKQNRD